LADTQRLNVDAVARRSPDDKTGFFLDCIPGTYLVIQLDGDITSPGWTLSFQLAHDFPSPLQPRIPSHTQYRPFPAKHGDSIYSTLAFLSSQPFSILNTRIYTSGFLLIPIPIEHRDVHSSDISLYPYHHSRTSFRCTLLSSRVHIPLLHFVCLPNLKNNTCLHLAIPTLPASFVRSCVRVALRELT
jgi:hypothetical protein